MSSDEGRPSVRGGVSGPDVETRPQRDHYSYTVYADSQTARTFDDRRFGGPIGELLAVTQARVLANFVGALDHRTILDVGTGTGRAALQFARAGAQVTAIDASNEMLAVARQRAAADRLDIHFLLGDAHALDFRGRGFDVVVSLRVMMHARRWRLCLSELCRAADQLVVFDYPSAHSFAALDSIFRRVAHALGIGTEPYRVFRDRTIADALARAGFRVRSIHRQFVLPIAFHKAVGSLRFTEWAENVLERSGLLKIFGSPVTLVAERCVSS